MKSLKHYFKRLALTYSVFVFFVLPASSNYQLRSYDFNGGGGVMQSGTYSSEINAEPLAGTAQSSTYASNPGLIFVQQANVPSATFSNGGNFYNKLQFFINTANNPTDTVYAIAISTDNFATTNYIQSDNTIGSTLGTEDFQTYTAWGGASGAYVTGLARNTTYYIKVKARQGQFTESPWGPVASAATTDVTLTFDIDVAPTDQSTNPPYAVSIGSINAGSVTTASDKVWVSLGTNANSGGFVYIYDQNAGLKSSNLNYTISSVSNNLTSVSEGYGLQVNSVTQSSGGPLVAVSPYDGSSQTVGLVDTTIRQIFSSSNSPVTGGRGSIYIKAKAASTTPASSDYSDTLTVIASASF